MLYLVHKPIRAKQQGVNTMTNLIAREVYDVSSDKALGCDDSEICYGIATTSEEAISLYMDGQSKETLESWDFTAEVHNGVWSVTPVEK